MSALFLENQLLHYEVFGRGQPVIFLHSWVGSWRYWVSTMDQIAVRYRTYALDFWGFGESERNHTNLSIPIYVSMLTSFLDTMGMTQPVNVVGHGLGGMVALQAAREHPDRFSRLAIVSTPLQGTVLSSVTRPGTFSRLFGQGRPTTVWARLVRQIPVDDSEVQQELYEDTDSLSEQVVNSVQKSILNTDLRPTLTDLRDTIPVLAIYGEKDAIVPPAHARSYSFFLDDGETNAASKRPHQLVILPGVNHFPFLEDTRVFSRILIDFLSSSREDLPITLKEHWRRRVSQREYL